MPEGETILNTVSPYYFRRVEMLKKTIAILVDWENIRKGIFEQATRKLNKWVDYNEPGNLINLIRSFVNKEEEIFRIFLYLSDPLEKVSFRGEIYDFSNEPAYVASSNFIKKIGLLDYIAVRKGKLKFRGFDKDDKPIVIQKQVDMLMGLDIAHLAYTKTADRILVLSGDTDIIPALKTARVNGLQVVIGYCSDVGNLNSGLMLHADFIRGRDFASIFS
jgi:uncharacterized LabA/DUF88 family protein